MWSGGYVNAMSEQMKVICGGSKNPNSPSEA